MEHQKIKSNAKFNNYQIPDIMLKKNISDIKNQIKAKLNFLKKENIKNMNKDKLFFNPSSLLLKQKKTFDKSNSSINKSIPSLFKSENNSKRLKSNNKYNSINYNSKKNYPDKLIKSLSCKSIKLIKSKNKRPSSSTINSNKYSTITINQKIFNSLINKNDENDEINENDLITSSEKIIYKSKNRIQSSNLKQSTLKGFNKLIKNENEDKKDYLIENKIWHQNNSCKNNENKIGYTLKLKNKSKIFESEDLRYKNNDFYFKENRQNNNNNMIPSFIKLNNIKKNNNYIPRTNRNNFSDIKKTKLKNYSMDNPNNNISTRNYIFNKDGKTKSLDNIYDKKNYSNLIHYKNIIYSTKHKDNNTFDKIKNYNDAIRNRNEQKNNNLNIDKEKKYSFYKYIEYMNKIEKEQIDNYLKEKEKKDLIKIQEIFGDISSKNKIKNNLLGIKYKSKISLKKYHSNKNNQNIKINYKVKLINKEENTKNNFNNNNNNRNKNKYFKSGILSKKNSTRINTPKKNTPKKYSLEKPKRKLKKKKNKKNDDGFQSSYTHSDIVIKNIESDKKNKDIEKIKNNNLIILEKKRNSFKLDEQKVLLNSEKNEQSNRKLTDPIDEQNNKNENIPEGFNYINNNDINIFNYITMRSQQIVKNNEIFNSAEYNYFKSREKLSMINRRNLLAKQLLLEKIKEADKYQESKRPSQFIPFFSLKYKKL